VRLNAILAGISDSELTAFCQKVLGNGKKRHCWHWGIGEMSTKMGYRGMICTKAIVALGFHTLPSLGGCAFLTFEIVHVIPILIVFNPKKFRWISDARRNPNRHHLIDLLNGGFGTLCSRGMHEV
jgi:hypothetical protein